MIIHELIHLSINIKQNFNLCNSIPFFLQWNKVLLLMFNFLLRTTKEILY